MYLNFSDLTFSITFFVIFDFSCIVLTKAAYLLNENFSSQVFSNHQNWVKLFQKSPYEWRDHANIKPFSFEQYKNAYEPGLQTLFDISHQINTHIDNYLNIDLNKKNLKLIKSETDLYIKKMKFIHMDILYNQLNYKLNNDNTLIQNEAELSNILKKFNDKYHHSINLPKTWEKSYIDKHRFYYKFKKVI